MYCAIKPITTVCSKRSGDGEAQLSAPWHGISLMTGGGETSASPVEPTPAREHGRQAVQPALPMVAWRVKRVAGQPMAARSEKAEPARQPVASGCSRFCAGVSTHRALVAFRRARPESDRDPSRYSSLLFGYWSG